MNKNKLLEKAIQIALDQHKSQTDKSGALYILHPLHIMNQVDEIDLKIVAVLHDVFEDSEYTFMELESEGFPKKIIEALDAITKRTNEEYLEYIKRVKKNPIAIVVKLEDLKHNLNILRMRRSYNSRETICRLVNKYLDALEQIEK